MSHHHSTHHVRLPDIGELEDSSPNEYNIMFKHDLSARRIEAHFLWMAQRFSAGPEGSRSYLIDRYTIGPGRRTIGYTAYVIRDHIQAFRDNDDILYMEPDYYTYCDGIVKQVDVPSWGLARLSRRERLEDDTNMVYYWDSEAAGEGVNAYVVDSGIFLKHQEFEGRASFGFTAYDGSSDDDTTGHGTHVAAIIGGKTYGVAKKAKLIGVKVFPDGKNKGKISKLIQGLDWVAMDASMHKRADSWYPKCVVNISISSSYSAILNEVVRILVESGLTVVVSAGNKGANAKDSSPASERTAITVGATTILDEVWGYSNFGPALNIYAPGGEITSAWIPQPGGTETNGRNVMSGTSQAAPHITGIAACIVSSDNYADGGPEEVRARIQTWGLKGAILQVMDVTINLLANNGIPQDRPASLSLQMADADRDSLQGEILVSIKFRPGQEPILQVKSSSFGSSQDTLLA